MDQLSEDSKRLNKKSLKESQKRRQRKGLCPNYRSKFYRFPEKLFNVVNEGKVISWTDDGQGIIIDEYNYERQVMNLYPGFVQVGTFHNLRRLLRDYGFVFAVIRKRERALGNGLLLLYTHKDNRFTKSSTPLQLFEINKEDLCETRKMIAELSRSLKAGNEGTNQLSESTLKRFRIFQESRKKTMKKLWKSEQYSTNVDEHLDFEEQSFEFLSEAFLRELKMQTDIGQCEDKPLEKSSSSSKPLQGLKFQQNKQATSNQSLLNMSRLQLLWHFGSNELDDPDFAQLMLSEIPSAIKKVSEVDVDSTLQHLNSLLTGWSGPVMSRVCAFEEL